MAGGLLKKRGAPKNHPNHPFVDWIFHEINHPAIGDFPFEDTSIYDGDSHHPIATV